MKQRALQIFLSGVNKVLPDSLIRSEIELNDRFLKIADSEFEMSAIQNIYILAFGKAAFLMAKEAEEILGNKITDGLVVTKYGHGGKLKYLTVVEAGHPIPDKNGVKATMQIQDIAEKAGKNDLVLCLISGGSSALLADYPEESSLNDLTRANEILINSGANISEINCVRKHLSKVKGGQLAKAIFPAPTVSLLLSDVIGDNLDVIASGPTAPDKSTYSEALGVIKKYSLEDSFPMSMLNYIKKGDLGLFDETPKPGDELFKPVKNYVIGTNRLALEGASFKARELGFETHIITDCLQGDYIVVADIILENIYQFTESKSNTPLCLLFGGEPTLKVTGNGLGGRNQHLALYLATKIDGEKDITILCAGTDGTDGPTDAAGAVIDNNTVKEVRDMDLNPTSYLAEFNSYHFFKHAGGHITIGNTGTNVMDLVVVLVNGK